MEKNKDKKRGVAPFGRLVALFLLASLACRGYAQEKHFARPVTLENDSTVKIITVYTFDNDSTNRWIKGTKNKPKGVITDSSFYSLLQDAYLPTLGEKNGNMLYDGEMIPLDGIVFGDVKVSNYANQKNYDELPVLKPRIVWHRTVYRYDATHIVYGNDTVQMNDSQFEKYKDSLNKIVKTEDKLLLLVECTDKFLGDKRHFAILVKDSPEPIKRKDFIIGEEVELGSDLVTKLGIRLNDEQTAVKPIERIAVVARGCPYSFIKDIQFAQNEDRTKILHVPKANHRFPLWIWIALGALVLVALCFFALRFFFKQKSKGKDEAVEEDHVEIEDVDEKLPQSIEALKKELETYKKAFADLQRELGAGSHKPSELVSKVAELKLSRETLQKEVELWKKKTSFTSPDAAHDGIGKLKSSIATLQEKNANLDAEKGKLKNIVDRVTGDPKSFKGDKDFKNLSDLIVDAEEGSKVRDKLNSDPDAIEPNSNTGILVHKGRIFDKYVTIADNLFKKKDSEAEIQKVIKDSPIAIQVRKGNFLDKAKDDVALIRKDEQGWLGDCELKTFIEYIVNPDEILKSQTRTNTGLYKLMYDIDNHIAKCGIARKKIDMDNLQYNWLKQRIEKVVEGYDDYLRVEHVASKYGTPEFDTSNLKGDVKLVFDCAESYRKFGEYKHYWKNITSSLFNTLDSLPAHDEIHNTRALMFYTSQFYSIACIMNEIYGDLSYSTVRPKYNASLFNSSANPTPTHYGFPILDEETLQKCRFEYKGAPDEDAKVKYMKQYKPLPFIFIFNYFDDNTLA